jgi:superfamily II DNA or RNA helicase
LLPVLLEYGGALCAEPVGTGKTFIALAIALAAGRGQTVACVPPPLIGQWHGTAARVGIPLTVWSHAKLSLGRLPPGDPTLVIVDESHHFRNPMIRRYRTLAPWLVGRRVLLLSATPVVNRSRDLYHQLHLGVRDDALAIDGAPSMRAAFDRGAVPAALGRFVVQRLDGRSRPRSRQRTVEVDSGAIALLPALDSLRLSTNPGIAALVRSVFLRAASSSAAALRGSLRRYLGLLLHARDAQDAGQRLDRASLLRFTGGADDQLLMWTLLPGGDSVPELRLDDLPALEAAIEAVEVLSNAADAKSELLRSILSADGLSVVFVEARETITYLRRQLGDHGVAWCTGARSGIGRMTMPRDAVLDWFRPGGIRDTARAGTRPVVLLATDVAAEGLDLQAARRLVHYDLPWTDVRLAQRTGRVVRRGAACSSVDVTQFAPGRVFEDRLHQLERLAVKAHLPRLHGLGPEGRALWQWRGALSDSLAGKAVEGSAGVAAEVDGVLAGIALEGGTGRVVSTVLWREGDRWTAEAKIVAARISEAVGAVAVAEPSARETQEILSSLAGAIRSLIREASVHRIAGGPLTRAAVQLGRRLRHLAAAAAKQRDAAQLAALESALAFCTGGHTAGEERLIEELTEREDCQILEQLSSLPRATPPTGPLWPRLTGLIAFRRP